MKCANLDCGNELINKRSDAIFCCKKCKLQKWHLDNKNSDKRKEIHNRASCKYAKNNKIKYALYAKKWRLKNPELVKNQANKRIDELLPSYVKIRLKRQGIEKITPEMIEQKRLVIKIKRAIKSISCTAQ